MSLRNWVENRWYAAAPGALNLLRPLESLYRLLQANQARSARTCAQHPGVPVIITGNLTVGGSGKSPVVAALARYFKTQGFRPGIVSRGYGGKAGSYPCLVTERSDAREVGDEPLMLWQQTGVPVAVAPRRIEAARLLVGQGCDLLLADDGLQHLLLARDIELVVMDAARGLGNGHCLPVGPLREPPERLASVDWLLWQGQPGEHILSATALPPQISYQLQQTGWRRGDGHWQAACPWPAGSRVHALAGIGHPQRFFDQLQALGLVVEAHPLADHASLTKDDLNLPGDWPVVMTAKDAVKLQPWLNERHWICEVAADLPADFLSQLLIQVQACQTRLQSTSATRGTGDG